MLYLNRVGEAVIAPGSIGTTELANDAVTTPKMANGAVLEAKIGNLEISTAKIKDNAISLAKADRALKVHHLITDDTEQSVLGTTETDAKEFNIVKASVDTEGFIPNNLTLQGTIKTSDVTKQGTLKVYVDAEGTARITINTVSTTYELVTATADISDLTTGKHVIIVKLVNAAADGTAYNQLFSAYLEK